jgi:hypothetical protein
MLGTFNSLSRVRLSEVNYKDRESKAVSARVLDELFEVIITKRRVKIKR